MCELMWVELTTCDVIASSGVVIHQIHAREINHFLDNGPKIRVRCDGWSRQLYDIKKIKMMFLNRWWPEFPHE